MEQTDVIKFKVMHKKGQRKIIIIEPLAMFGDQYDDFQMMEEFILITGFLTSNVPLRLFDDFFKKSDFMNFTYENKKVFQRIHGKPVLKLEIVE